MTWRLCCLRRAEVLANHTSFRIGGPAELFADPAGVEELASLLRTASHTDTPVSIIGGGTNCLVADRGIRGLVIRLGRAFRDIELLSHADDAQARVRCGAAVWTQRLVSFGGRYGWGNIEALAGLPGQVGGAVVGNAQNIGQFVCGLTLVSFDGEVRQLNREQLDFAYRYTALEPGIIADIVFEFPRVSPDEAAQRIRQAFSYRNTTQELRLPSAGCAFKNPPGQPAGRLIDQAGLKGTRIGDAQISRRHANFIVNVGQASCDDVLSLMEHVQRRVARIFGVWLEPEIRLLGERWKNE
ncbi:MAG: UDP-N-acetylmuramate dehydrogenase [Candidatus Omnitrophica bacterium]|nr:UDP-N-acetylmuramate dehydrogenase [Candidatus Omnitrophota bacterium]